MTTANDPDQQPQGINRRRLKMIPVVLPMMVAVFMFLPAGTWAWTKGWLFILVSLGTVTIATLYVWRVNAEVLVARSRTHEGTKRWDKILLCFLFPTMWAVVVVAALDDGRFHWCPLPWWVCGVGYLMLLVGIGIGTWAEAANRFFEPTVRIQTDRGQVVIDSGPYAIIRHPGYAGAILATIGIALSLGSLWALIPALLASFLLALRTHWEDQTLRAELSGYEEYAQNVRYKLIPGLW